MRSAWSAIEHCWACFGIYKPPSFFVDIAGVQTLNPHEMGGVFFFLFLSLRNPINPRSMDDESQV